jgi:hypothetical protein
MEGSTMTMLVEVVPDPAANSFAIHLNQNVSIPMPVAWFVVN